jgi:hypothetical protein
MFISSVDNIFTIDIAYRVMTLPAENTQISIA